jgi:carotenoid 1,2-hydratase
MTERGKGTVRQEADSFTVGPSSMHWDGEVFTVHVNERAMPRMLPMRGTVKIRPDAVTDVEVALHPNHTWRPFAPSAHIEVDFQNPGLNWQGHGYLDANFGTSALERDFRYWTWGRFPHGDGARTFYDVEARDGRDLSVSLQFGRDGSVSEQPALPKAHLPTTLWAVKRETRGDAGTTPRHEMTFETAPFYSRSMVSTTIEGTRSTGVHEALDCNRFANNGIRALLPARMPRAWGPVGWLF